MCYEHNNVAMYSIDKGITLYHYDSQQNGFFLIRTIVVKDTMYNHIYAHSVPVKTRNYTYVSPYLMEVQEISATRLIGVDR